MTNRFSARRLARHAEMNDVINMALHMSGVPFIIVRSCISKDDSRIPYGTTMLAECALGLTDPDDFIFSKKIRLWCSIKSKLSVVG